MVTITTLVHYACTLHWLVIINHFFHDVEIFMCTDFALVS